MITLRNVRIYDELSEETICYRAEVFIDEDRVGTAENDGKGGATFFRPARGLGYKETLARLEAAAAMEPEGIAFLREYPDLKSMLLEAVLDAKAAPA